MTTCRPATRRPPKTFAQCGVSRRFFRSLCSISLIILTATCVFADAFTNSAPPGISYWVNPLDHGSNTADVVIPNPAGLLDGSEIRKWNCNGFTVFVFDSISPSGFADTTGDPVPAPQLPPGEGFVFNNQSGGSLTIVFTGTPHVPVLPAALPCGLAQLNLLGRQTNGPGTYTNIVGVPPLNGAGEQIFNGASFITYTFTNNFWTPDEPPALNPGQSAFFFVPSNSLPLITQQPESQQVLIGDNVTFSVAASGSAATTYQWLFNGTNLVGATNALLTLTNVQPEQAGLYQVQLGTPAGPLTSSAATLRPFCFGTDIVTDSLEVTQGTQDTNNTVSLVADKATFVRGFAHVQPLCPQNTIAVSLLWSARLYGKRNGISLGPPLAPLNLKAINAAPPSLFRRRENEDDGFLFQLPPSWLSPGSLDLEMVVPPLSREANLANNSRSVSVSLSSKCKTELTQVYVRADDNSLYTGEGLSAVLARARSLLPVRDFIYRNDGTVLEKPYLSVSIDYVCCLYAPGGHCLLKCPYLSIQAGWKGFDLTHRADWADAMAGVILARCCAFDTDSDSHWVGAVNPISQPCGPAYPYALRGYGLLGVGGNNGHSILANMDPRPWDASMALPDWNNPCGGRTLAHELGHNYNRGHVYPVSVFLNPLDLETQMRTCGSVPGLPFDFTYPYDPCDTGEVGLDSISHRVIKLNGVGDLMSFASNTWVSKYNWQHFFNLVRNCEPPPPPPPPPSRNILLASGVIDPRDDLVLMNPFYVLPPGIIDPAKMYESLARSNEPGLYTIQQMDAVGHVLSAGPLLADPIEGPTNHLVIAQLIEVDPALRRLQILKGTNVLVERPVSSNAPVVTLTAPTLELTNETLNLTWTAASADGANGNPLFSVIRYSADDGNTWRPLAVNYPWLSFSMNHNRLPGSPHARVQVIATDGVNSGLATSGSFAVPLHPPQPQINSVNEGQRLPVGTPLQLDGFATDAEDGSLDGAQLLWTLSGPACLTNFGYSLPLANLSPGAYTATLTATDLDGMTASLTRGFEISPLALPELPAPIFCQLANDTDYTAGALVRVPQPDQDFYTVHIFHADTNLFVHFANLLFPGNGTGHSRAGLRIDPNFSRDASAQPEDLGFYVDEDGALTGLVGDGTNMVPSAAVKFDAFVQRGSNAWSAQLRIPDSLLGGTGHPLGLTCSYENVAVPADNYPWPPNAVSDAPVTWAAAYLGTPPPASNRPPVAVAGPKQILNVGVSKRVFLDGKASFDPDGDPLFYSWIQVAGPSVALTNAASDSPSFTAAPVDVSTELHFQLTVFDGSVVSPPAETVVLLQPTVVQPPGQRLLPMLTIAESGFHWQVPAPAGQKYYVQASTNLADWETIRTNTVDFYSTFQLSDDISLYRQRYFRGSTQP